MSAKLRVVVYAYAWSDVPLISYIDFILKIKCGSSYRFIAWNFYYGVNSTIVCCVCKLEN